MKRGEVLDAAKALITGDREAAYGTPQENLGLTAALWSVWLGIPITAVDVAMLNDLQKSARTKRNPKHADSYVDKAGYAALAAELAGEG